MSNKKNNIENNQPIKFYFVSGDLAGVNQECEYITDEQIEQLMSETPFGYTESYA